MVLWYNVNMFTPGNLYKMTTATSVPNSGIGTSVLTKPAGTEVASIVPGKKYSIYIPSAATFTTNFNLSPEGYTIYFYAKPQPGVVLEVDGNEVVYTGHSYTITNNIGEQGEIPVRSQAARLIIFTYSNMEMSLQVGSEEVTVSANTTDTSGTMPVSVLTAGGIVDNIVAGRGALSNSEIDTLVSSYDHDVSTTPATVKMFDENRDFVQHRTVLESKGFDAGEHHLIDLRASDCTSFKIEYTATGSIAVNVNGYEAYSGIALEEAPDAVEIFSESGGSISDLVITEYYSSDLLNGPNADFTTVAPSGTPAPTHAHDDNAANAGDTVVTITGTANTVAGWFKVSDGSPIPGVTMSNGVLTGTGLYVNGKSYVAGSTVRDWYFLTKTGATTGEFTSTVPTHAIYTADTALNAAQIDDLYESFLGNPVLTLPAETLSFTDLPGLVISTEWDIVASG